MQEPQRNPDPDTPENAERILELLKHFIADLSNEDLAFTQLNQEASKGEIGFLVREVALVLKGFLTLGVHDVQLVRYRGSLYGKHSGPEINRLSKERSARIVNSQTPMMVRMEDNPNENIHQPNRAQRRAAQRGRSKKNR